MPELFYGSTLDSTMFMLYSSYLSEDGNFRWKLCISLILIDELLVWFSTGLVFRKKKSAFDLRTLDGMN